MKSCRPAAMALVAIREGAAPPLRAALPQAKGACKLNVVQALGQIGDRESIPALRALVSDEDREVRLAAAWGLARMGDAGSVESLIRQPTSSPAGADPGHEALPRLGGEAGGNRPKRPGRQDLRPSARHAERPAGEIRPRRGREGPGGYEVLTWVCPRVCVNRAAEGVTVHGGLSQFSRRSGRPTWKGPLSPRKWDCPLRPRGQAHFSAARRLLIATQNGPKNEPVPGP